jgi:hypothetical protein
MIALVHLVIVMVVLAISGVFTFVGGLLLLFLCACIADFVEETPWLKAMVEVLSVTLGLMVFGVIGISIFVKVWEMVA